MKTTEELLTWVKQINARFPVLVEKYPTLENRVPEMILEYVSVEESHYMESLNLYPGFKETVVELFIAGEKDKMVAYVKDYCSKLNEIEKELLREFSVINLNIKIFSKSY